MHTHQHVFFCILFTIQHGSHQLVLPLCVPFDGTSRVEDASDINQQRIFLRRPGAVLLHAFVWTSSKRPNRSAEITRTAWATLSLSGCRAVFRQKKRPNTFNVCNVWKMAENKWQYNLGWNRGGGEAWKIKKINVVCPFRWLHQTKASLEGPNTKKHPFLLPFFLIFIWGSLSSKLPLNLSFVSEKIHPYKQCPFRNSSSSDPL